jgi:chitodextrinase
MDHEPARPVCHLLLSVTTALLAAAASVTGCSDGSGDGPGGTPLEPTLDNVLGLFGDSCAGATCHIGYAGEPAGGMDLGPEACDHLVEIPAFEVPALSRVVPGSPEQSYLVCKLDPACPDLPGGATVMPPPVGGLAAQDIDLLERWITAGAPGCTAPEQDVTPPAFAGARTATPLSQAVRLTWDAATDQVTPAASLVYLVYQAAQSGAQDFTSPVLETTAGATEATVTGLGLDTEYFFVVRARDAAGNVDANTAEVSATTLAVADTAPPSFDGVVSATPVGSTALELAWQPATDDNFPAASIVYHVYVSENAGGQDFGAPVLSTAAGATTALVTGLDAASDYFFVVRAEDPAGNQDANTVEVEGTTGDAVRFGADVEPILVDACARAGCHAGVNPAGMLDLRNGKGHTSLVGVESVQCPDRRQRVEPGNPDGSYIIDKLLGVRLCAGTVMPKGGTLPPAQIQIIRDWVAAGALDD